MKNNIKLKVALASFTAIIVFAAFINFSNISKNFNSNEVVPVLAQTNLNSKLQNTTPTKDEFQEVELNGSANKDENLQNKDNLNQSIDILENKGNDSSENNNNANNSAKLEDTINLTNKMLPLDKALVAVDDKNLSEAGYVKYKPNEIGEIMMLMYHGLKTGKMADFETTADDFKNDLQLLYDNNFRLVTTEDLINDNIELPAGMSPVLLSFDDGDPTAFSLKNVDGKLIPTPGCAIDIINEFSVEHPDFGKTAILYVYNSKYTFHGDGTMEERFKYLIDNGYEIGNHTNDHVSLRTQDANGVQFQVGALDGWVKTILPNYKINSICYPFGERPIKELRPLAISGEYNNEKYNYTVGIREGQSGASAAIHNVDFDALNFPRVRGTHNANTDFGWQLKKYAERPWLKYVSDGNVDRISVPHEWENKINNESLGNKELFIY